MAGHGGKGRRGGGHEEEHENHERWIVSYADFITLLFVLFVVMYAISIVDETKAQAFAASVAEGFGTPRYVVLPGSPHVLEGNGPMIDPISIDVSVPDAPADPEVLRQAEVIAQGAGRAEAEAELAEARAELASLEEVRGAVEEALAAQGLEERASYTITADGLTIALITDDVFFASASSRLEPTGARVIDTLAPVIDTLDYPVAAHGHANHLPLTDTRQYASNWELSAARAASVVDRLIGTGGVEPSRLRAVGFSATRPAVPIEDPEALTRNRRVDLVVQSTAGADARELLPELADADSVPVGAVAEGLSDDGAGPDSVVGAAGPGAGGTRPGITVGPFPDITPDIIPDLSSGAAAGTSVDARTTS